MQRVVQLLRRKAGEEFDILVKMTLIVVIELVRDISERKIFIL